MIIIRQRSRNRANFGIVEEVADDWNRHVEKLNAQPKQPSLGVQVQQGMNNMENLTGKYPVHLPRSSAANKLEIAANLATLGFIGTAAIASTALYIRRRQTKNGKVVVERVRRRQ